MAELGHGRVRCKPVVTGSSSEMLYPKTGIDWIEVRRSWGPQIHSTWHVYEYDLQALIKLI